MHHIDQSQAPQFVVNEERGGGESKWNSQTGRQRYIEICCASRKVKCLGYDDESDVIHCKRKYFCNILLISLFWTRKPDWSQLASTGGKQKL